MTADEYLPPDPPEHGRTAWEVEHLDDPPDDAGRYVEVTIPPADLTTAAEWRTLAEGYRRERDHWRDEADQLHAQMERLEDALSDLRATFGIGR